MKNLRFLLGVFTLLIALGCSPTKDINVNVEKVRDACDCADSFVSIANDILETVGSKTEDEMKADEELMKVMKPKFEKLDELENKCRKELEVKFAEMVECNDEVEEAMKRYEAKF